MSKLLLIVKSQWSIVLLILIIAAFLRFYNLTPAIGGLPPGLYPDEAMNGNNVLEALSIGNFKVFYPENNGREGLFINIQAVFLAIFGNQPWALRLPSALFGILTVLGVYFLTKELLKRPALFEKNVSEAERARLAAESGQSEAESQAASERLGERDRGFSKIKPDAVALFSAFFLAVSFWHINFSRIGFRAIMAPFFLIWGIYFLLKALNSKDVSKKETSLRAFEGGEAIPTQTSIQKKDCFVASLLAMTKKPNQSQWLNAILGGIFYGLGFYSYIVYRATPLLIFIILLIYWLKNRDAVIRKKILLVAFLFSLIALIVFAPLGLYFLQNPQDFFGRTTQISIFNSPTLLKDLSMNILKTAGMFNFIGDWNWRHNYAGRAELFWPVGILFLVGIFLGLRMFFEKVSQRMSGHGLPDLRSGRERSRESSGERLAGARDRVFREEYSQAYIVLFAWLIIAALPVVVSNEGIPHALRAILMAPAVFILAGIGGLWLYNKLKNFTSKNLATAQNGATTSGSTIKDSNVENIKTKIFNIFVLIFLSLLVFEAYNTYFIKWGQNPNVYGAFNADYVQIGRDLNNLPKELPKYVVVEVTGVDVRGIPMPAQTVMFITDTFAPEKQKEKNIYYVLPNQKDKIPENSYVVFLK